MSISWLWYSTEKRIRIFIIYYIINNLFTLFLFNPLIYSTFGSFDRSAHIILYNCLELVKTISLLKRIPIKTISTNIKNIPTYNMRPNIWMSKWSFKAVRIIKDPISVREKYMIGKKNVLRKSMLYDLFPFIAKLEIKKPITANDILIIATIFVVRLSTIGFNIIILYSVIFNDSKLM